MHDDFFIDCVDIEWGLRVEARGIQSFGVRGVMMAYDRADESIQFLGKRHPLYASLMHYFSFCNALWMCRRDWLPAQWRLADGLRLLLGFGFYPLFAKPGFRHLRMIVKGGVHGLVGRMRRRN